MNPLKKAMLYFRKEGLKNTLRRIAQKLGEILRRIPGDGAEMLWAGKYARSLAARTRGRDTYIIMAGIDWNIPLFQRPHQIAIALSQRENAHVIFVSEKHRYDFFAGRFAVNERLDVISLRMASKMKEIVAGSARVTVFKSWPTGAELLETFPYDKLVYEYIDDISLFYYYTEENKRRHYELMGEADLTVCTARALYEDALPVAKKAILSPNAGDYRFFHDKRSHPAAPGLREQTENYSCVLGYYGCLASWFDYELVLEVAKKRPDWCFVLVGYCFDNSVSRLHEAAQKNIIVYPAQPYEKLPSFVRVFDIQTIPFVLNDITRATSPVKLFEYMASQKPILTSPMPECLQYRSVETYSSPEDFIEKAEQLLAKRQDPDYLALLDREARENTWEARTEQILRELNGGN